MQMVLATARETTLDKIKISIDLNSNLLPLSFHVQRSINRHVVENDSFLTLKIKFDG